MHAESVGVVAGDEESQGRDAAGRRLPRWGAEQIALLGTDHDEVIAARLGRSVTAVRHKRTRLRIPPFVDRRLASVRPGYPAPDRWSDELVPRKTA